jgi:hypothetical protein
MDILDRITIWKKDKNVYFYYLNPWILTVDIPGRNNFSHCDDRLLFISNIKKKKSIRQERNLEHLINNTLYSSNEKRKITCWMNKKKRKSTENKKEKNNNRWSSVKKNILVYLI